MDEMYRHLSIEVDRHEQKEDEVRPKWTVTEGIEKFFQSDQREVKCEKCEEGTTATQTLSVKSRCVLLAAIIGHSTDMQFNTHTIFIFAVQRLSFCS
jgi:uncharacterized UBP type Zn finger protein